MLGGLFSCLVDYSPPRPSPGGHSACCGCVLSCLGLIPLWVLQSWLGHMRDRHLLTHLEYSSPAVSPVSQLNWQPFLLPLPFLILFCQGGGYNIHFIITFGLTVSPTLTHFSTVLDVADASSSVLRFTAVGNTDIQGLHLGTPSGQCERFQSSP